VRWATRARVRRGPGTDEALRDASVHHVDEGQTLQDMGIEKSVGPWSALERQAGTVGVPRARRDLRRHRCL